MQFYKRKFLTTIAVAISILMLSASCEQLGLTEDDDDTDLLVLLGIALTPESCSGTCKMFVSNTTFSRNLGLTGADNLCNSDANKPSGNITFKAMITHSTDRVACTTANCSGGISENVNWVLKPNTKYVLGDTTKEIFTTDSKAIFEFGTLTNPLRDTGNGAIATGLTQNWTLEPNCQNWSTESSGESYRTGATEESDHRMIYASTTVPCNDNIADLIKVLCVEQ